MFKEKYNNMNKHIVPEEELVNKVINSIEDNKKGQTKIKRSFRKPVAILASLLLIVITATPILASKVPDIYNLMYLASPTVAQFFMPVQESSEDNGIKMEVVSAYVHDNIAEIYITIQDLIENRIDETTDLNDSYSINRSFDGLSNAENIGYDEKTGKATFLITITEWGNKKITGDKITFSVSEFLSGKKNYKDVPIGTDLTKIDNSPLVHKTQLMGGFTGPDGESVFETTALVPSDPMDFPVEGIDFTGVAYIDDMLHIQTSVENNLTKDNHGEFFLKNKDDNIINIDYGFSYAKNPHTNNRIDYYEDVFDVPQSEIGEYELFGDFWVSTSFTTGDWQVTFPLKDKKDN